MRPYRDAGHLVPRDWAASLTLLRRSLRGRAVSLMGRARACTLPSLDSFSALAVPAGQELAADVALHEEPRITARTPSGVAGRQPFGSCVLAQPAIFNVPMVEIHSLPSRHDKTRHQDGALGVMWGVSRSAARTARLPAGGQRQGREVAEQRHAARTRTSHQREGTAPQ